MLKQGDISWIVPDQIIALSSPIDPDYIGSVRLNNYRRPVDLIDHFFDNKVKAIVRLNSKLYDKRCFERNNI